MTTTIIEFAGMDSISWVIIGKGSSAYEYIYRSKSGISWNIIEIDSAAAKLYSRFRVPMLR